MSWYVNVCVCALSSASAATRSFVISQQVGMGIVRAMFAMFARVVFFTLSLIYAIIYLVLCKYSENSDWSERKNRSK